VCNREFLAIGVYMSLYLGERCSLCLEVVDQVGQVDWSITKGPCISVFTSPRCLARLCGLAVGGTKKYGTSV
jgi:hypothetical protein